MFCLFSAQSKAAVTGGKGDNTDSTTSLKSNIVIFKMMTGAPATNNGSLKTAGKVARTSNSHSSVKNPPALPSEG